MSKQAVVDALIAEHTTPDLAHKDALIAALITELGASDAEHIARIRDGFTAGNSDAAVDAYLTPQRLSYSIGLDVDALRDEAHDNPNYTQAARDYIDGVDDATIGDAIRESVDDFWWEAFDRTRSDALSLLFAWAGIDPEKDEDEEDDDDEEVDA